MITVVSYNARYAKLRGVKKAHFPDFCRLSLGWLIFRLGSTVLRMLCAAESVRLFLQRLCVCFIMFHAAFYDLQFAAVVDHSS